MLWTVIENEGITAQVCPGAPQGFGGCRLDGTPCAPDNAGAGGGAVNPELVASMKAGDRSGDSPNTVRSVLNAFVWKPPFVPERMEEILTSSLAQHIGDQDYPGDTTASENWPGIAPGRWGPINAMAPIHQADPMGFLRAAPDVPCLWVRGVDDPVVADGSLFELGTLGAAGAVPGWPGAEDYPPQPMISQTEAALKAYEKKGGRVTRVALEDCGHTPFLEKPRDFDAALHALLTGA